MSKRVAVLYGGLSTEREVSLRTGKAIFEALQLKPYEVTLIDVDRDITEKLKSVSPDVAVIALHGKFGEDGCIQGLLEILNIPYTGPGVMASSVAMNKNFSKKIMVFEGIPTPAFMSVHAIHGIPNGMVLEITDKFKFPIVVKAANQGSSIGVCFALNESELVSALDECLKYDNEILIEEFIRGRELTVSVIGNEEPVALPILEIVSPSGVYDYHAKYTAGGSQHFVAELPKSVEQQVAELAVKTYKALACRGLSRIDFMLTEDNRLYVLEANTSPGMTATSLFPDAAKAAGISFPDLIEKLIDFALDAHQK